MEAKIEYENYVNKPRTYFVNTVNDEQVISRFISEENESKMDELAIQVENYMSTNNGYGLPDNEKDVLYEDVVSLLKEFNAIFKDTKYTFYLNKEQHEYILSLIKTQLTYNIDTVFVAMELLNLIERWDTQKANKNKMMTFEADATEVTYIYHLISKHTIKGINKQTRLFAQILMKIGEVSKIINYYDTKFKGLKEHMESKWVPSFDDEPNSGANENESISAKLVEPNS